MSDGESWGCVGRCRRAEGGRGRGEREEGCSVYRSRRRTQVPCAADSRASFLSLFARGALPTPVTALWLDTGIPGNRLILPSIHNIRNLNDKYFYVALTVYSFVEPVICLI